MSKNIFWEFKHFYSDYIIGIVNQLYLCECKKVDEQIIENRIEIDRSEAEKSEYIHESCIFSSLFPTYEVVPRLVIKIEYHSFKR